MTERTNGHGMYPWGRLVLFVLFLIFLAIVLKAMGWCVGGVFCGFLSGPPSSLNDVYGKKSRRFTAYWL